MTVLQIVALTLVGVLATAVALTQDPRRQLFAFGFFGLSLGTLFMIFQAPDVALSQIGVGSVLMPMLILIALAKVHEDEQERAQAERERDDEEAT